MIGFEVKEEDYEVIIGLIVARVYYLTGAIENYKARLKTDLDEMTRGDLVYSLCFLQGEQNNLRKLARNIKKQKELQV